MNNHLTIWRKEAGLTLKQAADLVKVDKSTWWRWERGLQLISLSRLPAVARLTGLSGAVLRPDIQHLLSEDVNK